MEKQMSKMMQDLTSANELTVGQQAILDAVPMMSQGCLYNGYVYNDKAYPVAVAQPATEKSKPVVTYQGSPYIIEYANGDRAAWLGGIKGHAYIEDGSDVRTSKIVSYDEESGRIETLNTIYVKE
jgi:hypothetical protein